MTMLIINSTAIIEQSVCVWIQHASEFCSVCIDEKS